VPAAAFPVEIASQAAYPISSRRRGLRQGTDMDVRKVSEKEAHRLLSRLRRMVPSRPAPMKMGRSAAPAPPADDDLETRPAGTAVSMNRARIQAMTHQLDEDDDAGRTAVAMVKALAQLLGTR